MWTQLLSFVDFEYHVLEFDAPCAKKWAAAQSNPRVHVHIGRQNSTAHLDRLYSQCGGEPFDTIVDDGPHLSEFQHTTLTHMIERVAPKGFYAVEDIHSSCKDWIANEPGRRANPHRAPTSPHPAAAKPTVLITQPPLFICRRGWHFFVHEDTLPEVKPPSSAQWWTGSGSLRGGAPLSQMCSTLTCSRRRLSLASATSAPTTKNGQAEVCDESPTLLCTQCACSLII